MSSLLEQSPVGNTDLFIIQPTPFCNLDCTYCYLPDRGNKGRITRATLEASFSSVLQSGLIGKKLTVVWHAGEPLVLPPDFYEEAFAIAQRYTPSDTHLTHSFQTNAVLITDEWCRLFKRFHTQVGVSIDGPAFLHDRHRKTRDGKGTWHRVMEGVKKLQAFGVDFHVISVLTRDSLHYPDELFDFYVEQGMRRVAFNVEEIEGVHQTSSIACNGVELELRDFLARFFDLATEHDLCVRELQNAKAALLHGDKHNLVNHQVKPFGIISIDYQGNISTFSPELMGQPDFDHGNFIFGNVHDDSPLSAITDNVSFKRIAKAIESGVDQCRLNCPYFGFCGGGAPANKYYEHGRFDVTETVYCRLTQKVVLDLVIERLEGEISPIMTPLPA